ncbi:tetratricopeptide repeat protein, partial [candidate division TA06 bacterium]
MARPKQKERLEYVDDLTGLHNRRYFREKLLEEKRRADKKGSSFALAMIDLDNFKPINDFYGHLTGDQVLSQVAALLEKTIRPSDILCRYAGDEFVMIFPEIREDDVIRVAERIKENLAQASWTDEKGEPIQPVTCSLGYTFYAEKGRDLEALVGWADQALYTVKRRGGNGHCGEKDIPKKSIGRPLVSTPYIVGRDSESARLRSLLQEAHQEKGRLVLIHGEAGVGKTRLVKELQQILERRGGTALVGGCHEETRAIHYYPFREAFSRFFSEKKEERSLLLKNLPGYSQRELARILPGLTELQPSELDRAPDPFRLFEAVRLLFVTLTKQAKDSLLFIVEDLHWSDGASLDLLQYLARNLKKTGVLLCGTYRTEEAVGQEGSRLLRFAGSLQREGLSEEIALEPLSAESISAMVRLLYPGIKVSRELQDFLYQKTEGNPFFAEELLKFLTEEEVREGLPKIQEVPQSVHAVLQRRIDSLDPGTKEILACGALIGEEFEFEVLQTIQDRSQREILDAVEAGVKTHIVRESFERGEERYRFIHALMADVLYSGIGKVRRRLWHGQAGEALENIYAGRLQQLNGRLVYHFERGEKWEKGLNSALRSARQAKNDYANQEAIHLYRKAREILPRLNRESEEERIAIAEGLGDVYQITGDYEKALEEYRFVEDSARAKGEEKKEADALSTISKIYDLQDNFDEMMAYAEKSYGIYRKTRDQKGLAESLHSIGSVHMNRGDYDEALECYKKSLKIREEIGEKRGAALSLRSIGIVHVNRGDYAEALDYYKRSLNIQKEIGNKRDVGSSLNSIGNVFADQGKYAKALEYYEDTLAIRREIGDRSGIAGTLFNIGRIHSDRGNYGKALKCLGEALKIQREIGNRRHVAMSLNSIGIIHWNHGDYDDALRCYEKALKIQREIGDTPGSTLSLHNIGIIHANRGNYGKALKCYEEALNIQREIGGKRGMAQTLHSIGVVHWSRGDYEQALKCHEESLSTKREIGDRRGVAVSLISIGNIHVNRGDYTEALKCYEEALNIQREIGDK